MTDFALILNPKYKDIIPELWYEAGIVIPIVWNPFAEEGKCYVVTDKDFVMDARANMHKQYFGGRAKDFLMSDTVKQKLESCNTGVFELDYMDGFLPQYEGEWITDKKEE